MAAATGQRKQSGPVVDPAAFNRLARLQRHAISSMPHQDNTLGRFVDLPNVGYHYRCVVSHDLSVTSVGGPTGRWLSGHFGGNTTRFTAPFGLLPNIKYALNVSSPIYSTDAYGNYILNLLHDRGLDPYAQVAVGQIGRNRKERFGFSILNNTTGALVTPDSLVAAATDYRLRAIYPIHLTLGESAGAGLVPAQDIRIAPQLFLDTGSAATIASVAADLGAITGNYDVQLDYFTIGSPNVKPDTSMVLQTRQEIQAVTGTGEQIYRPQIGGIFLKEVMCVFNNSRAIDPVTVELHQLRVQQNVEFETLAPRIRIGDELRWYSKRMPDEMWCIDHTTGLGDPTMPSLRDRIASNQMTRVEYILRWAAGTAVVQTAEIRHYLQQLLPRPKVM
jgi:hypothetical protein